MLRKTMFACIVLAFLFLGCSKSIVFYDTMSDTELDNMVRQLNGMTVADLFRLYPTLRFIETHEIGGGNISHQFTYIIHEPENLDERGNMVRSKYSHVRINEYTLNIFVNSEGVIYEVLEPIFVSEKVEVDFYNPIE